MCRLMIASLLIASSAGCLPRTIVKPNPGPKDRGIRYYRPKPYLFVKPMVAKDGTAVDGMVTLEMTTLPDFSEEYSIHIRSGLGINETSVTLEDGWNLTSINVNIDSNIDDNVTAVSDLVGSIPKLTEGYGPQSMNCKASNVPMGLYEAVVSRDNHGIKRLYGFRYVGFLPYASCPTSMHGQSCESCLSGAVYGLVYENGMMVFRELHHLPDHVDSKAMEKAGAPTGIQEQRPPHPVNIEVDDGFEP